MAQTFQHVPILLSRCIEGLSPKSSGVYLDGTLGGGGHAEAVLERIGPGGRLYGIDRDGDALCAAGARLARFGSAFCPIHGNFKEAPRLLQERGVGGLDGILLDLGVSSWQLDAAERGFSYNADAPLDMRMDQTAALTAYDVVNTYPREALVRILREYGEEKWAPRIAAFMVERRSQRPIATTGDLVDLIMAAIPAGARRGGPHPAKRAFQAIRIEVNAELDGLGQAVCDLIECLKPEGRLCVITFHSLEDRAVKQAMRRMEQPCTCPASAPACVCGRKPQGKCTPRKPILPGEEEIARNPRSRSAKLRIFIRNDQPAFYPKGV